MDIVPSAISNARSGIKREQDFTKLPSYKRRYEDDDYASPIDQAAKKVRWEIEAAKVEAEKAEAEEQEAQRKAGEREVQKKAEEDARAALVIEHEAARKVAVAGEKKKMIALEIDMLTINIVCK